MSTSQAPRLEEDAILQQLSTPDDGVIETLSKLRGDLLMLGAGGKIGLGLTLMARRALTKAGKNNRVIAVSRFRDAAARAEFERHGVTVISADLSDIEAVQKLPDASDVIYLAGQKFGTADGPATTWLLNSFVPGIVARRWKESRIALYSSGNVYPFFPVTSEGPNESIAPGPIGEYAMSVLGRERVFEYFSRTNGTKMTTIRLNYANEPRYGVLVDLATRILAGETIDLAQGYVNIVSQWDCNLVTLKCLDVADSPPRLLNLAGPKLPVGELIERLGKALGVPTKTTGSPAANALLSDSTYCWKTFGAQKLTPEDMIQSVAAWMKSGGRTMGKPTHFEARDGKF